MPFDRSDEVSRRRALPLTDRFDTDGIQCCAGTRPQVCLALSVQLLDIVCMCVTCR